MKLLPYRSAIVRAFVVRTLLPYFMTFVFAALIIDCRSEPLELIIVSDIPEVSYLAEVYNTQEKNIVLRVIEDENAHTTAKNYNADFVITSHYIPKNSSLPIAPLPWSDKEIAQKKVDPYNLLLAYSTPLVIIHVDSTQKFDPFIPDYSSITLSQIQKLLTQIELRDNGDIERFGFVPWMNESALQDTFDSNEHYLAWLAESGIDLELLEREYRRQYSPVPPIARLAESRIYAKLVSSHFFWAQPRSFRTQFMVYTLRNDDLHIPALAPAYLSLLQTKPRVRHYKFIKWLLDEKTQLDTVYLQYNLTQKTNFLGRSLSTNWDVNNDVLFFANPVYQNDIPFFSETSFSVPVPNLE